MGLRPSLQGHWWPSLIWDSTRETILLEKPSHFKDLRITRKERGAPSSTQGNPRLRPQRKALEVRRGPPTSLHSAMGAPQPHRPCPGPSCPPLPSRPPQAACPNCSAPPSGRAAPTWKLFHPAPSKPERGVGSPRPTRKRDRGKGAGFVSRGKRAGGGGQGLCQVRVSWLPPSPCNPSSKRFSLKGTNLLPVSEGTSREK